MFPFFYFSFADLGCQLPQQSLVPNVRHDRAVFSPIIISHFYIIVISVEVSIPFFTLN
jgi:hypothetical protein